MTLLEQTLAKVSLGLGTAIGALWQPCRRCESVRWRWHRHTPLPLGVVLELSSSAAYRARREGGDVA